jgi:hypothetical protein
VLSPRGSGDSLVNFPPFPSPQLTFSPATLTWEQNILKLHAAVEVPAGALKARLGVLLEPNQEIRDLKADATDAGKPLTLSAENGGRGIWHWFYADLTPGKHSIEVAIHSYAPGHISTWLLSSRTSPRDPGALAQTNIEHGTHLLLEETIR